MVGASVLILNEKRMVKNINGLKMPQRLKTSIYFLMFQVNVSKSVSEYVALKGKLYF